MKCQFCNEEIADGSLFCTSCGKKQEKKEEQPKMEAPIFCTQCGTKLKPDARFCVGCGTKLGNNPKASEPENVTQILKANSTTESQQPKPVVQQATSMKPAAQTKATVSATKPAPQKKSGGIVALIIVLVIVLVMLITVGVGMAIKTFVLEPQNQYASVEERQENDEKSESSEENDADTTEVAGATESNAAGNVDFDLSADDIATFTGTIKNGTNGLIIKLEETVCVMTDDGYVVDDIKSVYINNEELPYGMLEWLELGEKVTIQGETYYVDNMLCVIVTDMTNADGKDMIDLFETADALSDEYILPDSDTVRLTKADIAHLTLQELNYAKNEIYARHGRKFDSQELRDYFNSKSWYNGTIDPSDFSDSMLSKIERENVTLIKNAEFAINPKGYPLDQ